MRWPRKRRLNPQCGSDVREWDFRIAGARGPAIRGRFAPIPDSCVREEFEAFLRCGVLDHGFLRVVCEQCHADKFVWNEFEQP